MSMALLCKEFIDHQVLYNQHEDRHQRYFPFYLHIWLYDVHQTKACYYLYALKHQNKEENHQCAKFKLIRIDSLAQDAITLLKTHPIRGLHDIFC